VRRQLLAGLLEKLVLLERSFVDNMPGHARFGPAAGDVLLSLPLPRSGLRALRCGIETRCDWTGHPSRGGRHVVTLEAVRHLLLVLVRLWCDAGRCEPSWLIFHIMVEPGRTLAAAFWGSQDGGLRIIAAATAFVVRIGGVANDGRVRRVIVAAHDVDGR
jgi:hypothetical protein